MNLLKYGIILIGLIVFLGVTSNAAEVEANLSTLCGKTTWGARCNDGTPDLVFNYTYGACTSMNFTAWCGNVTGGGAVTWLDSGTNYTTANNTQTTWTANRTLGNYNYWACFLNATCGSDIIKTETRVIYIDAVTPNATKCWTSEADNKTNNHTVLTLYFNASDTYVDTVWVNSSGSNTIELSLTSSGLYTGTGNLSYLGCVEGSCTINCNINDTAGSKSLANYTITIDNTILIVTANLSCTDADGILQNNQTLNCSVNISVNEAGNLSTITMGGYPLHNVTGRADKWYIDNMTALELNPDFGDNCTYTLLIATITDTAGNEVNSTNSTLLVFPCLESHSASPVVNTSVTATADTLTITFTGNYNSTLANSTTLVHMPGVYYNATHMYCPYKGSNVNRTDVYPGPLNTSASVYCNITLTRTAGNSGTVVVQQEEEYGVKESNPLIPAAAGAVVMLIIWATHSAITRKKSS